MDDTPVRNVVVRKTSLHEPEDGPREKSPQLLVGMMWQLALDAWAFKDGLNVEPRLQRDVVVLKRREG
jgi:hypothetical protein